MRLILCILIASALSGCVRLGPKPPRELLTLSATTTSVAGAARSGAAAEVVTVLVPSASPPIAAARIPVYQDNSVAYVEDALLADTPGRQLARVLSETIAARTGRIALDLRQAPAATGLRLQGTLVRFGIEERNARAIIVYDALVIRPERDVVTRRFEASAPVAVIEARPAGAALNVAANDIAVQVADWIKSL